MLSLPLEPVFSAFILLLVANGAPIVASRLLGSRYARPVDSGRVRRDGRAIFGPTKTWRGIVAAIGATAMVAGLMGLPLALGAGFGALSMGGDLLSSFLKRQVGAKSSASILGVDQIPEAILPTTCLAGPLGLGFWDVLLVSLGFLIVGIVLSRIPRLRE